MDVYNFERWFQIQQKQHINVTKYFEAFIVYDRIQNQYAYAYKLLGLAKIQTSFYQKYKVLSLTNIKDNKTTNLSHNQTQNEYQSDFIDGKVNSLLMLFLIKAWRTFVKQTLNQSQICQELFGKKYQQLQKQTQKQNCSDEYQHYMKLFRICKQNAEITDQQIENSFPKPQYKFFQNEYKSMIQWQLKTNILQKLEIIPMILKYQRIKILTEKHPLWKFKLAQDNKSKYIIVSYCDSALSVQLLNTKINKILQSQNKEITMYNNLESQINELKNKKENFQSNQIKLLGRDICYQLMKHQEYLKDKGSKQVLPYIWLQPRNILILNINNNKKYHISHQPLMMFALGISKQPMSFVMRLTQLTPRGINLYKAPQQCKNDISDQISNMSKTVVFKFILLLHHYSKLTHLYENCSKQMQMINRFNKFQDELINKNTQYKDNQNNFIDMMMRTIKKLQKKSHIQWEKQSQRPNIQDLGYFLFDNSLIDNNIDQIPIQLKQFTFYQFKKLYCEKIINLSMENQVFKKNILSVQIDILKYFLSISKWIILHENLYHKGCLDKLKLVPEIQKLEEQFKLLFKKLVGKNNSQASQEKYSQVQINYLKEKNQTQIKYIKRINEEINTLVKQNYKRKQKVNEFKWEKLYYKSINDALSYYSEQILEDQEDENDTRSFKQKQIFLLLLILRRVSALNYSTIDIQILTSFQKFSQKSSHQQYQILEQKIREFKQIRIQDKKNKKIID